MQGRGLGRDRMRLLKDIAIAKIAIIIFLVIFLLTTIFLPACVSEGQSTAGNSSPSSSAFVGSINSNIYHYPSCGHARKI